jgi:predicted Zn-ribbon and HTH transcriptional regulator
MRNPEKAQRHIVEHLGELDALLRVRHKDQLARPAQATKAGGEISSSPLVAKGRLPTRKSKSVKGRADEA